MSDYWHAVRRAALGLPGSAEPRPRSIFEREPALVEGEWDGRDEEIEAPAAVTAPPPPRAAETQVIPADAPPAGPARLRTEIVEHTRIERSIEVQAVQAEAPAQGAAILLTPPQISMPIAAGEADRDAAKYAPEPAAAATPPPERAEGAPASVPALQRAIASEATLPVVPPEPARQPAPVEDVMPAPPPIVMAEPIASAPALPPDHVVPEPPLVIEIGRIDIRIGSESAAPPAPRTRAPAAPVLSLGDYLAQRGKAER